MNVKCITSKNLIVFFHNCVSFAYLKTKNLNRKVRRVHGKHTSVSILFALSSKAKLAIKCDLAKTVTHWLCVHQ